MDVANAETNIRFALDSVGVPESEIGIDADADGAQQAGTIIYSSSPSQGTHDIQIQGRVGSSSRSVRGKNVTIIEGFPGFGLIGTIATEFLMEHLKTEKIGIIEMDEVPAMIAIHQNKVIEPVSLHYNKDYNMVLVHAINVGKDLSWKLADQIQELAETLSAKEIISLEGVGSPNPDSGRVFYYATESASISKRLAGAANPLMEGIIEFEKKLKGIIQKGKDAEEVQDEKLNYVG